MPNVTSSFFKTQSQLTQFTDVEIINPVTSGTANTETSILLPSATTSFTMRLRKGFNGPIKYTFISGESGTTYAELLKGAAHRFDDLDSKVNWTLYVQSPKVSQVLEIKTLR